MVICTDGDWISFVQINNIKVTIDSEICLFFSEPKSFKNKLEFNRNISDLLLIKFGVPFWASALDEKFVAIKFLFTYSPILSKLMKYDNISDIKIIDNEKDIYFGACCSLRFHRQLCPAGFLLGLSKDICVLLRAYSPSR